MYVNVNVGNIRNIVIIAHSAGGHNSSSVLDMFGTWLEERDLIKAVAWTDCGDPGKKYSTPLLYSILRKCARNWVTSTLPGNTVIDKNKMLAAPRYSAGHTKHEWTSAAAHPFIFQFIDRKLNLSYHYC